MTLSAVTKKTLKLGQINFINCLPLNGISNDTWEISLTEASPSQLNQMLRAGDLDLAPISSFEYLLNQDKYELIEGLSISSKKQADSVLLFVQGKLEESKTIYVTDKSASSVNLLKIILVKKYNLDLKEIEFIPFNQDREDMNIKLLIGDEALLKSPKGPRDDVSVIDLGTEWFELTGLPMVFGLWVMNKSSELLADKTTITQTLCNKRDYSLSEDYPDLIIEAYRQTGLNKSTLKQYFENLDYNFTEKHRTSLSLFAQYLKELDLLC